MKEYSKTVTIYVDRALKPVKLLVDSECNWSFDDFIYDIVEEMYQKASHRAYGVSLYIGTSNNMGDLALLVDYDVYQFPSEEIDKIHNFIRYSRINIIVGE